ncbi:Eukaryotic translation initiation factor 3 subunit H, partial [Coemansia spiralis]
RTKRLVDRSTVADDADAGADSMDGGLSGLLPTRPAAYLSRPMCTGALSLGQGQTEPGLLSRQLETIGDLLDKQTQQAHQWIYWKRGEGKDKHRRQQFVQRAAQGNAARVARGEAPEPELTEAELDKMFKSLPEPSRLDTLLNTANLDLLTKGITQSRGPALTKMFMTQGLHESSRPQH